jgi:IS5 family transposase
MEKLLKETIEKAKRKRYLRINHLERVNVNTTLQEKAMVFPTDARLYHKMWLN